MGDWGKEINKAEGTDWGREGLRPSFQPQYPIREPNNGLTKGGMDAMMGPEVLRDFEIKRAAAEDLPKVWEVIDKCAKWLAEKGLNHWADHYTEELVGRMIEKQTVYLGSKSGEPVSTITFSERPPKYYAEDGYLDKFTGSQDSAGYVMAVAVLPELQGKGLASEMLQYVEDEAYLKKLSWLRLDARAEVPGLIEFYEKRGFKKVGEAPMDEGKDGTYWLMEKKLQ